MTNGLFADRKLALGFAGATVAFAIVAAISVGVFIPIIEQQAPEEQVVEAPESATQTAQPAPAAPTWSDEGSFADDWNGSAVASANGNADWGNSNASSGNNEVEFSEYRPDRADNRSAPSGRTQPGPSARSGGSSGARQPKITSGAAPNAPPIAPPGGRGSGSGVQP